MLCCFRLVLEGTRGGKITKSSRFKFLGKVWEKNFSFHRSKSEHLKPVKSRFIFIENTSGNNHEFLGSYWPFCVIDTSNFSSFSSPFATITSLSEFHFRYRSFILLV